jgi:hypothetical protein
LPCVDQCLLPLTRGGQISRAEGVIEFHGDTRTDVMQATDTSMTA